MKELWKKKFFSFFSQFILIICLIIGEGQLVNAQDNPLTYSQIITALNNKYPNKAFKSKLLAIKHIISEVKKRGVEKALSKELEEILIRDGATDELIETIKANSPTEVNPQNTKNRTIKNSIGMEFVLIPPGSFMMGSNLAERNDAAKVIDGKPSWFSFEGPVRKVNIGYEFFLGKYEVTIGEWLTVMGELPDCWGKVMEAKFKENNRQPIVCVSWNNAKEFVRRLNAMDEDYEYRLPSESEWEYACRAGTTTAFAFGNTLTTAQANFDGSEQLFRNALKGGFLEKTVAVGSYQPNVWGVYDMHGNVSEWVEDYSTRDATMGYKGLVSDGSPNLRLGISDERITRGGSWDTKGHDTRSATRFADKIEIGRQSDGFRLVVARIKKVKVD